MSDEEDYDVVLDTLQKAYDRRNEMVNKNSEMGMLNIMDSIRLEQMDELSKAIELWKSGNFLSTPEPTQDEEPVAWVDAQRPWDLYKNDPNPQVDALPLFLHPAPRPEFVRLSEEEVNSLTYAPYEPYELICAVENRLVEKNK